jgi:two-component system cell cycle sensor histidine kinase/response regulator CckA
MFWLYFAALFPAGLLLVLSLYDFAVTRARPPFVRQTILLVDDDRKICEVVGKNLERQGFKVLWAMDGETALNLAHRHRPQIDLLISDVVMPRMTGLELAERVRASRPSIPVLLISGAVQESTVSDSGRSGMAYLEKPFDTATLRRKIQQVSCSFGHGRRRRARNSQDCAV